METRTTILIAMLVAVVAFAAYFFLKSPGSGNVPGNSVVGTDGIDDSLDDSLDVLDAQLYEDLETYNDLPIRSGDTGTSSIFGY